MPTLPLPSPIASGPSAWWSRPVVRAQALARRAAGRLVPVDVFAALNVVLFLLMCVFTYYARFVQYRGAANIWEFFVYASVIFAGVVLVWSWWRPYRFGTGLLVLVQAGILIHFAGAFVQFDGMRLYDCQLAGIRYDKLVHFANAFVAALMVRHILVHRSLRLDAVNRLLILLVVLGLGAFIEIVEYIVCKTIPGNGVGAYDNNMQDLAANLLGAMLSVLVFKAAPGGQVLRLADSGLHTRQTSGSVGHRVARRALSERALSAAELAAILAGMVAGVWLGVSLLVAAPWLLYPAGIAFCVAIVYMAYVSPVHLHGDSLAERGLGSWRTLFVRTDNLGVAARQFGWLGLACTTGILLVAEVWNPGWFARANWQAWVVRLLVYALSASVQMLLFIGFYLPRLKSLLMPPAARGATWSPSWRQTLLACVVSGLMFGALHAPGLPQMVLTAAFAAVVTAISLRTPNVFAAAACHTVLGLLVHRILELSLRVGSFYYHPEVHFVRDALPFAKRLIGNLF